jgi:CheY-like chemotaxis protein
MRAPHYRQDSPAVARASQGPRLSVLLVEDDRADALLVEELIADAAIDTGFTWAPSISEAERELARNRPDCVLLDLNLPDANGIDALTRISNRGAGGDGGVGPRRRRRGRGPGAPDTRRLQRTDQ